MTSRFENVQLNQCGLFKMTSHFTGRFSSTLFKGDPPVEILYLVRLNSTNSVAEPPSL